MTSWDNYAKEAEKGTGGEWPEVPDDLYDAMVQDVSDPETGPDQFNAGKERTQFYITFELVSDELPENTTLRYYVTIPEGYINDGYLSDKSRLYKVMDALGFDMGGRFTVDPRQWQGERVRVMVENKVSQNSTTGEARPRITDVKAPRRKGERSAAAAPAATPPRKPVAAAAGKRGGAPFGEDDEDD